MGMFENKIAVVTGAGGTLCSEIAVRLAEEGAKVFLVGRTAEKLEKVAHKIAQTGCLLPRCQHTRKSAGQQTRDSELG